MFCPYMFYKVSLNQKQVVFSVIPIFREDSQCNDITKGLLRWFLVIQPKKPKQPKRLQKRMKFYLYMSDTQAEVCQDISDLTRKFFPRPLQIPLERTPEIPALVHFLSSSNTTRLAFFNSHTASPQARVVLSLDTKLSALYRG